MRVKDIIDEDFTNYKKPSMFIGTIQCSGKCCTEQGLPLATCQNDEWRSRAILDISDRSIIERYLSNEITQAIVFGGLEPFEQGEELIQFVRSLRNDYKCDDMVVIYTGYYPIETTAYLIADELAQYGNIIIKWGRYIPDSPKIFDAVLGVTLASDNQFAEVIC